MKKARPFMNETLVAGVLIVVLFLVLNPSGVLMLSMMQMSLVIALAVLVVLFAGMIWKETSADEREELHRLRAGRYGYLAGLAVGVIGVIIQAVRHAVDPWLIYTLGIMILAKVCAHVFNKLKN